MKIEKLNLEISGNQATKKLFAEPVSLEMRKGDCFIVSGPIGTGKSLFFKAISGEHPFQYGKISTSMNSSTSKILMVS